MTYSIKHRNRKINSFPVYAFLAAMSVGPLVGHAEIPLLAENTAHSSMALVPQIPQRNFSESFADLIEPLMPAVVNISTTKKVKQSPGLGIGPFNIPELPFGFPYGDLPDFLERYAPGEEEGMDDRKAISLGSGFVIDSTGYIVTNFHVIDGADEITITFADETTHKAKLIGKDGKTDLALLKVEINRPLPFVIFGDAQKTRVGDRVITIGNPYNLGGTVTQGIISARSRDIGTGGFDDFLQTDAAINRGNSGGPMFNMHGEVIGINTVIFSPSGGNIGIGFAIPSSLAQPVIQQLREHGRTFRGWVGVSFQSITTEMAEAMGLAKPKGALVVAVMKGSPADKAGIVSGDVILTFDGNDILDSKKLPRMVGETKVGKEAPITLWRQGKPLSLKITVGEYDENQDDPSFVNVEKEEQVSKGTTSLLHVTLSSLTPYLREKFGIDESTQGLIVLKIDKKTKAKESGIMAGDVITSINQTPISTIEHVKQQIELAEKSNRKFLFLHIMRQGEIVFVTLPLDQENKK